MDRLLKKIGTVVLLLTGFLPVLMFVFFLFKQHCIYYEMKKQLEKEHLQTIRIPEKEVHWIKSGKEILVEGKMFDLESFSQENGYYRFTGLFDETETDLVNQLRNNFQQPNDPSLLWLAAFFHWLQAVTALALCPLPVFRKFTMIGSSFNLSLLPNPFRAIFTPPPQGSFR